jgi:hypothetical protein
MESYLIWPFLEDKLTNVTHNSMRFYVMLKVLLGTDDLEVLESQVVITSKSKVK